jgi:endonuclease G
MDDDLSTRAGYDPDFLGAAVPVPVVRDQAQVARLQDGSFVLHYEHFSIVMERRRRLALFTASNVDASPGAKEPEPGRDYSREGLAGHKGDKWVPEPRIAGLEQLPDRFFNRDRGAFDKGHIVRREDVCWGTSYAQVVRANADSFHVTNCSPQVANFNQSRLRGLWGQLENIVLDQAEGERYSLLAGPVFADDDPPFDGVDDDGPIVVEIPRRFWKVVVARGPAEVQAFAFVLEQDLTRTPMTGFAVDAEWQARMVSIGRLEELVDALDFPAELHAGDQAVTSRGAAVRAAALLPAAPALRQAPAASSTPSGDPGGSAATPAG